MNEKNIEKMIRLNGDIIILYNQGREVVLVRTLNLMRSMNRVLHT